MTPEQLNCQIQQALTMTLDQQLSRPTIVDVERMCREQIGGMEDHVDLMIDTNDDWVFTVRFKAKTELGAAVLRQIFPELQPIVQFIMIVDRNGRIYVIP